MLVSVIIPCYNQGKYLNDALNSVLNQTYDLWECIVVDDGSTDNTGIIAKNWVENDDRFRYYYKENGGVSSTRNFGLDKATGDFLQFLDCDDLLDNKKFDLSLNEFQKSDTLQMVVSNFNMISDDLKNKSPAFCELKKDSLTFENFLYNFFSIQLQCGFFEVSLFDNIRFPENLSAQEDWVVWILIFKRKPNFVFIDIPLAYYRMNPLSRMKTLGAGDNQIKIFEVLKNILTYNQYHKFSVLKFTEFYNRNLLLQNKYEGIHKSKFYLLFKVMNKFFKK